PSGAQRPAAGEGQSREEARVLGPRPHGQDMPGVRNRDRRGVLRRPIAPVLPALPDWREETVRSAYGPTPQMRIAGNVHLSGDPLPSADPQAGRGSSGRESVELPVGDSMRAQDHLRDGAEEV